MPATFRTNGKQILRGGIHFADAGTDAAASKITAALNLPDWLEDRASRSKSRQARRIFTVLADDIRAGLHED